MEMQECFEAINLNSNKTEKSTETAIYLIAFGKKKLGYRMQTRSIFHWGWKIATDFILNEINDRKKYTEKNHNQTQPQK